MHRWVSHWIRNSLRWRVYIGPFHHRIEFIPMAFIGCNDWFLHWRAYHYSLHLATHILTMKNLLHAIAGILFGIIMVKSEAVSWFRIQEMFHFQSFHMYGIIGSAVVTGAIANILLKRLPLRDMTGNRMQLPDKPKLFISPLVGGSIFGLGWAMTGACPGPLFVNLGAGYSVMVVIIVFAILGAFVHGLVRKHLPL